MQEPKLFTLILTKEHRNIGHKTALFPNLYFYFKMILQVFNAFSVKHIPSNEALINFKYK